MRGVYNRNEPRMPGLGEDMRKIVAIVLLGAMLGVSGCGQGEKAGVPVKRDAGQWKTDVEVVKIEVPGMAAEMAADVKQMMEEAGRFEQCLTQQQVDGEDLAAELVRRASSEGACGWAKKHIGGGKIDVAGTCTAEGKTVDMRMDGTVSARKTDVTVTIKAKGPAGGDMNIVTRTVSTHIGPCKAGAPAT